MDRDHFSLNDRQFTRLVPHLPTDTRGKPRVDGSPGDKRHCPCAEVRLSLGGRAAPLRPTQDALQSLRALGGQRSMARALPCAGRRRGPTGGGVGRPFCSESSSLRLGRKRGEHNQAIGRSRGGRTTKIHALTDTGCRPIAFLLTGGQVADCIAADELLDRLVTAEILHGDKGYDSNAVRRKIERKGG